MEFRSNMQHIALLTFSILIILRDVIAPRAAHCLGADVSADRAQVTLLFENLHVAIVLHHPANPIAVDLGEDELSVVAQVDVALLDGLDRRWTALHQSCNTATQPKQRYHCKYFLVTLSGLLCDWTANKLPTSFTGQV